MTYRRASIFCQISTNSVAFVQSEFDGSTTGHSRCAEIAHFFPWLSYHLSIFPPHTELCTMSYKQQTVMRYIFVVVCVPAITSGHIDQPLLSTYELPFMHDRSSRPSSAQPQRGPTSLLMISNNFPIYSLSSRIATFNSHRRWPAIVHCSIAMPLHVRQEAS